MGVVKRQGGVNQECGFSGSFSIELHTRRDIKKPGEQR